MRNSFLKGFASVLLAVAIATPALAQVSLPTLPSALTARAPFQPLVTVYAEDFEVTDGGFVASGNASWEHGAPTVHVQPSTGQGPGMWATNLHGTYDDRACGYLESPAIDLRGPPGVETGVSAARLVFRHWMQAELTWDGGVIQASSDGKTWRTLVPTTGYVDRMISSTVRDCLGVVIGEQVFTGPSGTTLPAPDAWREVEVDLTAFLGGAVYLRWAFATDTSDVRLGWYVDDVLVQLGAGAQKTVFLPSVNPETGVNFTPVANLYIEDFEVTDGGWVATGTPAWQWGEANAPPLPPPASLNLWGTRLDGSYEPGECAYLTSPTISLPGAGASTGVEVARVTMELWRHLRSGYDGAQLQVSADGGATWAPLVPHGGYDRTLLTGTSTDSVRACLGIGTSDKVWSGPTTEPKPEAWMSVAADLSAYMGRDINLRLAFASGTTGVVYRGVYMADVLVQVGAGGRVDVANTTVPGAVLPGWSVVGANASWEYGVPSSGPFSSRPVWATNLDGGYNMNECSGIVSPAIDTNAVAGLGRLSLTFEHFFDTQATNDGGVVQVSQDDGATWVTVAPVGGYPSSLATAADNCLGIPTTAKGYSSNPTGDAYGGVEVPLTSYQGKVIRVKFAFASDGSTNDFGWYVRNVALTRGGAPVPLAAVAQTDLLDKADARLRAALLDGNGPYQAIVLGPAHPDLSGVVVTSRAEALATLGTLAAPFFEGVGALVEAHGGEVLGTYPSAPAMSVRADAETLAAIAARDDVSVVALDGDDSVQLVDPVSGTDEGDGVGAQNREGRVMLQAEDIWAAGYRGEGVKLAMIDTGIDATHEAFRYADGSSRVVAWLDLVNSAPTPYDDQGHGTHVAGTAAGSDHYEHPTRGVNQEVGVAPAATLLVAKFLNSGGSGSFANAISALEWSYGQGADITSNSWGSSCSSGSKPVMESVRTLTDLGMLSVFAAGNSGPGSGTVGGPGCSESALTVGAVGSNGVIASFSSRGPCTDIDTGSPSRICPDVVAKGYLVRSAAAAGSCTLCHASGYIILNGTSMATPHAAGAVALAEQMKRALTGTGWDTAARAEEQVFKLTSLDLGSSGEDNTYGWGLPQLLNVYALLSNTDDANVVASFGVSKSVVRQGDATTLTFSVRNLGSAVASGQFVATLTAPDGSTTVLRDEPAALALLDGKSYVGSFLVTGAVDFGTYTFRGQFDHSWTNGENETVSASLLREATFVVNRVDVRVTLDGLAERSLPLALQEVTYTAQNVGNEDAQNVRIEFTLPDDYVFVPGDNYDPTKPLTRYASPAPNSMTENANYGRVTLVFDVGALPQGASFSFTTKLEPTTPGAYRVLSVAKFFDGAGNAFSQGVAQTHDVGAHLPA